MATAFKFPDEDVDVLQQNDGSIEIEVVDDTPERDKGRRPLDREVADPTDAEIESYTKGAQDRIKELTHARHDERRAKEAIHREKQELERLAQHMYDENNKLKQYVNNGTQQYNRMAETAVAAEVDKARRALKAAQEAFDTDGIIAAQEALTEAKMDARAVRNFSSAPLQQEEYAVQTRQPAPQQVQPDEKTLRWQAKNQWFGANGFEELTSFALGLHQKLVNTGIDPRSDEYYERIDARVKDKFPEVFGETEDRKSSDSPRRPTSVVAPAARSSGARKIQLTPTQIALAKKYGLTPQQYAVEVAKLEKNNG
jgi:hypothetical protein